MPVDNRSNPGRGRDFETLSGDLLSAYFKVPFRVNIPIPIGHPAKIHKFDLVSDDKRYVGECKNQTWTETGNIPSAKMAFLNQAVLYLSLLPFPAERCLVLNQETSSE